MDFTSYCLVSARTIKCIVVVDDAKHQSLAIVREYTIDGSYLTRFLDCICAQGGMPAVFLTEYGPEFMGKAMFTRAHCKGLGLRLMERGKPNPNACVESFNGRLREGYLNERWCASSARSSWHRGGAPGVLRRTREDITRRNDAVRAPEATGREAAYNAHKACTRQSVNAGSVA